ncbi:hypothetical protein [Rubellimicrobium mesophilum]|uniref:hypothetical protein n=1 Tax=Rubellimicrobium mesophilum TaxID=1123067 RepID=UPI0012E0F4C2|nr:hypothetical protein [Rubellimicrobium mesophilum]
MQRLYSIAARDNRGLGFRSSAVAKPSGRPSQDLEEEIVDQVVLVELPTLVGGDDQVVGPQRLLPGPDLGEVVVAVELTLDQLVHGGELRAGLDHLVVAGHQRVVLPAQVDRRLDVEMLGQRRAELRDLLGLGPDDELRGHQDRARPGLRKHRCPFGDLDEAPAGMRQEGWAARRDQVVRVGDAADGGVGHPVARQDLAVPPKRVLDRGGAGLAHADVQDQGPPGGRRLLAGARHRHDRREGPHPAQAAGQLAAEAMGHVLADPAKRGGMEVRDGRLPTGLDAGAALPRLLSLWTPHDASRWRRAIS